MKGEDKRTGSMSHTINFSWTAGTTHLLEACRIAVSAGAVVINILAHGEGVRAAPDALDLIIACNALSSGDTAMGIGPVSAIAACQNDVRVHPGA